MYLITRIKHLLVTCHFCLWTFKKDFSYLHCIIRFWHTSNSVLKANLNIFFFFAYISFLCNKRCCHWQYSISVSIHWQWNSSYRIILSKFFYCSFLTSKNQIHRFQFNLLTSVALMIFNYSSNTILQYKPIVAITVEICPEWASVWVQANIQSWHWSRVGPGSDLNFSLKDQAKPNFFSILSWD